MKKICIGEITETKQTFLQQFGMKLCDLSKILAVFSHYLLDGN